MNGGGKSRKEKKEERILELEGSVSQSAQHLKEGRDGHLPPEFAWDCDKSESL